MSPPEKADRATRAASISTVACPAPPALAARGEMEIMPAATRSDASLPIRQARIRRRPRPSRRSSAAAATWAEPQRDCRSRDKSSGCRLDRPSRAFACGKPDTPPPRSFAPPREPPPPHGQPPQPRGSRRPLRPNGRGFFAGFSAGRLTVVGVPQSGQITSCPIWLSSGCILAWHTGHPTRTLAGCSSSSDPAPLCNG